MATIAAPRDRGYELTLLLLLTLANGVVAFDRLTVAFLAPYIVGDLGLTNAEVGWLAGALSGAIALSAFFGGRLADKTGRRRTLLIACTLLFSLGSGAGGLAMTFTALLAARFALGIAEGPMVPIGQTVIAEVSEPARRGVNMGVMQMVGAFGLAGFLGPIVATQLAEGHGWRTAMFLSILPGLLLALLLVVFMRPDPKAPPKETAAQANFVEALATLLRIPNMRVALAIAAAITAWLVLQNTFLTLFLTQDKGLSPTTAGWVVSMGGIAGIVGGVGLPFLSDRVGRKPVLLWGALACVGAPLALLLLPGDPPLLAGAILIGWLPLGVAPLYCATVPAESVSPALVSTAVGLSMGTAELVGGVILPPIAGQVADIYGLSSVFCICAAVALVSALAALFIEVTAPRVAGPQVI
jgi:MFS family permease